MTRPGKEPRLAGTIGFAAGPLLAALLWSGRWWGLALDADRPVLNAAAAVAVWMAVWWITEALPLAVTALLPVVLFPLAGIMDGDKVAREYFNHVIFLFIGGFIVALAMERWNLHKRIALKTLLLFGVRPRRILLGFMAAILFLVPSKPGSPGKIMDWAATAKLPWGIVLLFGGGFALAAGFRESGLSLWIGRELAAAGALHPYLLVALLCLAMTFVTELTSNTATTQMILPILAGVAAASHRNPLLLMIPVTLSCSCAFMMPVATPPNAIIFGTGRLHVSDMAKTGLMLNLIGVVLVVLGTCLLGGAIWGIDIHRIPDWAVPH